MTDSNSKNNSNGFFNWQNALWVIGILLFLDGAVNIAMGHFTGLIIIIMGLILFPPYWKLIVRRSKTPLTKVHQISTFVVLALLLLIVGQLTQPASQQQAGTSSSNLQVKKDIPTPTPTDPCWQYAGTDQIQQCAQMQDAMKKGKALQYPLKATVSSDVSSVYITNNEANEWDDCTATIDDTNPEADNYQSDVFTLKPGQIERLGWATFTNLESQRFNFYQTKPSSIDLDCTVSGQEHRSIFTL